MAPPEASDMLSFGRRTVSSAISVHRPHRNVRWWACTQNFNSSLRREHPSASRLRLTQTRSGNLEVGFCPNLFKLRLRFGGFICVFALPAQSFCKSKQRPAVVGQTRQVLAIDLLGFG